MFSYNTLCTYNLLHLSFLLILPYEPVSLNCASCKY